MPNRPPRLPEIFPCHDPAIYFITFNTSHRAKLLANAAVHAKFLSFIAGASARGITVGCHVLMPDHIHLFVRGPREFQLQSWIRSLKLSLSAAIAAPRPHWQEGFFDHLLRNRESYEEKQEYVRLNPVRAKLVSLPEEWPFRGEGEGLWWE